MLKAFRRKKEETELEKSVKRLKANDPSLTELYLGDNSIGNRGAKAIAKALKDNTVLTTIVLSSNSIGYDGAKAIAEALMGNTVSTKLDLGNNEIDSNLLNDIQKLVDANKNHKPTAANTTELISEGRSKMKEAMDNVDLRPIELPKEFIISCTNNFAEERKLGHGSFGAVYKGMDGNQYFAVKCLRFNLDFLEDQKKGMSKSFENELQVLKRFRHPHIVTLYGYHLSPVSSDQHVVSDQYLVYELLSKGSLDRFYKSEQSRSSLSSKIRLRIMNEIISAIDFLHTIEKDGHTLFHRVIKSSNICLDQNYTAKLIDCGLAKFVPKGSSVITNPIPSSVCYTAGDGTYGTPAYTCPFHFQGGKFEASCDVYSFGIVMIELVTGCLQSDSEKLGDFYECYFPENFEGSASEALEEAIPKLVKDADPLAKWEEGILSSVCALAIRCIQTTSRTKRPETSELVEGLGQLVSQATINEGIAELLSEMQRNEQDADIKEKNLMEIANLAVNDNNKVTIAKADGINTILSAMKYHISNANVQHYGCLALWNLTVNDDNQVIIAKEGGITMTLTAMKNHSSNANVQHYGCAALGNLAVNDNNKLSIVAAGGFTLILTAMKNYSKNANVQHYGCAAFGNLAVNYNFIVAIANAGGITTIRSAMKNHSSNVDVQENGRKALSILFVKYFIGLSILFVKYCIEVGTEIAKAGGILMIMIIGIITIMLLCRITHGLYLQETWSLVPV